MFQGRPRNSADLLIVHSLSSADLRLRIVHARHHRYVQLVIRPRFNLLVLLFFSLHSKEKLLAHYVDHNLYRIAIDVKELSGKRIFLYENREKA